MALGPGDLAWTRLFGDLDRGGPALHLQIRRTLVAAIAARLLAPDARLPSSRQLAALLGIARNTVNAAYGQLINEGILLARERSGVFVAAAPAACGAHGTERELDWSPRFAAHPSRLPQITKPRDWLDFPYPFLFGQFDPSLFPTNDWRESVRAASSVAEIKGWAGDLIDEDDRDLVEQLRAQVLPRRGILASPDEILITIGSQQALSLLVDLLVGRGVPTGIEDPGYPDVRAMVRMKTNDVALLTVDGHGVVPDAAFASRRVAFVTVAHQCPTTVVMPLDRRRALLAAASAHDIVLVEDDYDTDLMAEGAALPALKSLDRDGRVIHVGSFSKVLAPGLRIGYVVAPRAVVAELRALRRLVLRHPPSNNQRATAMFIALGHYRSHLRRANAVLGARAARVAERLPAVMPGFRWRCDPGATSFWIEGPAGLDARALAATARRSGVLIEPGDIFFADPAANRRFFRLGFASIGTERICEGLRRLAAAAGRPDCAPAREQEIATA